MNLIRRRKILKRTNALDLVPVRVVGHAVEQGKVVLLVPKFKSKFIHRLFPLTEQMFFRIRLDDNGTRVWNEINGEFSNWQLVLRISDSGKTNEEFQDTQDRFLKFISLLYEREYISFRQLLIK